MTAVAIVVQIVQRKVMTAVVIVVQIVHRKVMTAVMIVVQTVHRKVMTAVIIVVQIVHRKVMTAVIIVVQIVHRKVTTAVVIVVQIVHKKVMTAVMIVVQIVHRKKTGIKLMEEVTNDNTASENEVHWVWHAIKMSHRGQKHPLTELCGLQKSVECVLEAAVLFSAQHLIVLLLKPTGVQIFPLKFLC
jgi:hypothetical protein